MVDGYRRCADYRSSISIGQATRDASILVTFFVAPLLVLNSGAGRLEVSLVVQSVAPALNAGKQ